MRTIWKYVIEARDTVVLTLPVDSQPLCVMEQDGALVLWVEVDPRAAGEVRTFHVRGTGNPFVGGEDYYIGSAKVGPFVWHLYEGES